METPGKDASMKSGGNVMKLWLANVGIENRSKCGRGASMRGDLRELMTALSSGSLLVKENEAPFFRKP